MAGLSSCGLVHQCPWCGAKIRHGRTQEILQAFGAVVERGGAAHLLTLTLPHDLPDQLSKLLAGLDAGWKRIPSGAAWTRLSKRIGYLGYYYAEEILCSCEAAGTGWHPHLHVLIFTSRELEMEEWVALQIYARTQWQAGVTKAGLRRPHDVHGCRLDANCTSPDVARYVGKLQEGGEPDGGWTAAHELARGDLKDGRAGSLTPFQLVAWFLHSGDTEYLARWRQYVAATKGRRAIGSSRGLRAKLGLDKAATDAELAAAEVEDRTDVASVPCPVWRGVLAEGLETELLDVADVGDLAEINAFLRAYGLGQAHPPGGRDAA